MTPQLTYYNFGAHVTAFSTTRHGGFSVGCYGELNVNAYCGDQLGHVSQNRKLLSLHLGLQATDCLLIPHQVHDSVVRVVDERYVGLSALLQQEQLEGVDALVTNQRGICIGVSTADCIPILIYDPVHHCSAVVHAGWRGTVKRIAEETIRVIMERFHSNPASLCCVIGPGISLKNFEVGQEVCDAFSNAGFPMEKIAKRKEKWHIDLPLCNRLQMEAMGIGAGNIYSCGICTYDRYDDYFSARRLGVDSGRIFSGIILH